MTSKATAYFSRKMLITVAFGFSSGLPLALVFGTLSLWLKDYSIAYRTIGAFSLLRLPYSFKWLWAPLVETYRLPLFCRLGKRRGWALLSQLGLLFSLVWLSVLSPADSILAMAAAAFCVSLFSATQDIVLDAFRVELFRTNQEGEINGATMYVLGYRLGNVVSGAGAIGLAAVMPWNQVYFINALLLAAGIAAVLTAREPADRNEETSVCKEVICESREDNGENAAAKEECKEKNCGGASDGRKNRDILRYALIEPFCRFMRRPHWVAALFVVFCYRLSDAYFAPMAYPFYDELGFSKAEIAYISKLYGMGATIAGGLLGGCVLARIGLLKGLLIFAVVQGLTTALYIPLYYAGHNVWFLMLTISLENLSSGMATTAIIAFMSVLCDKGYTATQYALLSSLPGFARDVFASTSGWVLDQTSWPAFFLASAALAVPGTLLCLYLYKKKPEYLAGGGNFRTANGIANLDLSFS